MYVWVYTVLRTVVHACMTTHIQIGLHIYIYDHPPPHFDCPQSNGTQQRKSRKKKYKDIHIHRQYGIMKTKRHKHRIPKMCEYAPYRNM